MKFSEKLNHYIALVHCSSKELAQASRLSESIISRYRKGNRLPSLENLKKLGYGLSQLSLEKYTKEEIIQDFLETLNKNEVDFQMVQENLNCLIHSLKIHAGEMAKYLNFDASYLSKIRKGERIPSNKTEFIHLVALFILKKDETNDLKKELSILMNCLPEEIGVEQLEKWLRTDHRDQENSIALFLKKLDEFDLENYIRVIHFDTLKVPTIPFYRPKEKNYYGLEEMKNGELDFFKATVLSKSKEDIFMCSDMDMEDMALDNDFAKKWMFAVAASLKKGLHLNIIHQINRPFNEMMLGLESWIPIYMTGQITPYYLPSSQDSTYQHLNYTSGTVALVGESIRGYHKRGKYFLATNRKDVEYYQEKSQLLLKKAKPLMNIYTQEQEKQYQIFLLQEETRQGKRLRTLNSLPIFTIPQELILKILKRNGLDTTTIQKIVEKVQQEKERNQKILMKNVICDQIELFSSQSFSKGRPFLALEFMFYSKKIYYTWEEYNEHLQSTLNFAKQEKNYRVEFLQGQTFKNISISSLEDSYVVLSKAENPVIHFVIQHPKLRDAILNFRPLVQDIKKQV